MKYKNESMPGPGDQVTWPPCTNNPLDPRTEEEPEDWHEDEYNLDYEEPDDDFLDKSDTRETDELHERDEQW